MLNHLNHNDEQPKRVVILGAGGFVGGAVALKLSQMGVPVLSIARKDIDLLEEDALVKLGNVLKSGDSVVAAAAIAPVKNTEMLIHNLQLVETMVNALARIDISHIVNIGSDAIYADSSLHLREDSSQAPTSLHGVMHLTREMILKNLNSVPIAMLRPTLIYGRLDPHNGYGPNRFWRQSKNGEDIVIFGQGEERRDHVLINDVADLVIRALFRKSYGTLNIATGQVHSFFEIAQELSKLFRSQVGIQNIPRNGPIPHDGFRAFDISATKIAFPDFEYTDLKSGLRLAFIN